MLLSLACKFLSATQLTYTGWFINSTPPCFVTFIIAYINRFSSFETLNSNLMSLQHKVTIKDLTTSQMLLYTTLFILVGLFKS